jgi:hypothetical protein
MLRSAVAMRYVVPSAAIVRRSVAAAQQDDHAYRSGRAEPSRGGAIAYLHGVGRDKHRRIATNPSRKIDDRAAATAREGREIVPMTGEEAAGEVGRSTTGSSSQVFVRATQCCAE